MSMPTIAFPSNSHKNRKKIWYKSYKSVQVIHEFSNGRETSKN